MDLAEWVNPYYLHADVQAALSEAALGRPANRYAVLDNVFRSECIEMMARHHHGLCFRDDLDRHGANGELLPYDAGMKPMDAADFGAQVLLSAEFARFCAGIVGVKLAASRSVVKLRRHRAGADGFWVHTDAARYGMAVLGWYNRGWKCADGGLLQIWRVEDSCQPGSYHVKSTTGRLDLLRHHQRIHTDSVGGGFAGGGGRDLALMDQILPEWNRIVILNFQSSPVYHSVTPSEARERFGFVLWVEEGGRC